MKGWYAIFCKPQQDARATLHLCNQGYEVFRPLARLRLRTAGGFKYRVDSLFPRYQFIRLDDNEQSWAPIRSTRGVVGLVQMGDRRPAQVPDALVADLKRRTAETGWVDLESEQAFYADEPVTVVDGAFAGAAAIFECRTASDRVIVLLSLLGATRRVELPESAIIKASG